MARITSYAEAIARGFKTTTGYTDRGTALITHTPSANAIVLYYWESVVDSASLAVSVKLRLYHDTAAIVLNETIFEPQDLTDKHKVSGFYVYTYGASPGSNTVSLEYETGTNGIEVGVQEARIWSLELTANDKFVIGTDTPDSTTGTTLIDATSGALTFTPGSVGDYLILACIEWNRDNVSGDAQAVIDIDGVDQTQFDGTASDVNDWHTTFWMENLVSLSAASHTIKWQFASGINTTQVRRARVIALRLSDFPGSYYAEARADTSGTEAGYITHQSFNPTIAEAVKHFILSAYWVFCDTSISQSAQGRLFNGTTAFGESINEANESSDEFGQSTGYEATLAAGAGVTWTTQRLAENTNTTGMRESAIAILQINDGAAAAIFPPWRTRVQHYMSHSN